VHIRNVSLNHMHLPFVAPSFILLTDAILRKVGVLSFSQDLLLCVVIITFPNSVKPLCCSFFKSEDADTLSTGEPCALEKFQRKGRKKHTVQSEGLRKYKTSFTPTIPRAENMCFNGMPFFRPHLP